MTRDPFEFLRDLNGRITPRQGLFGSIVVCLVLFLTFCTGCTSAPARQEVLVYTGCNGKGYAATVQVHVGLPLLQCPARAAELGLYGDAALYALAGAAGCAFWSAPDADRISRGEVYLFPGEPFLTHELDHVRGMRHWPHAKEGCNG